jgi:hypothetical protein
MKKFFLLSILFVCFLQIFAQNVLTITTKACVNASEVKLTGPFWQWGLANAPGAVNNGDGTWTFTLSPAPTANMDYLLVIDGMQENLIPGNIASGNWSCTPSSDQLTYANRSWIVGSGNIDNTYGTCSNECTNIYGCMNTEATNFNMFATIEDQSCLIPVEIPINFELGQYSFTDFDGSTSKVVSNPNPSEINMSSKVVEHVRDGGQFWAGTYISTLPIDFSSSVINMKIHSPATDVPVLLKFEDPISGANVELTSNTSLANEWEELSYDFGTLESGLYSQIVIIFNMGTVGDGSVNSTYYFDDITFATGPIGGCMDTTAYNYNSLAVVDDGSCAFQEATLNITATVCDLGLTTVVPELRLTGPFWGWDLTSGPIGEYNGNGTWTFTLDPTPQEDMEFLLVKDGVMEDLVTSNASTELWDCTPITDYFTYANRKWEVGSGDIADLFYETCELCENPLVIFEKNKNINNVYPNPAYNFVSIDKDNDKVEIFRINGQKVMEIVTPKKDINISHLPKGLYMIKCTDNHGLISFNKLVKN